MPKMRGFKPELWTDEKFVDLDPFARLLFMGMWTYACDNGHLDDKPKQIKMRVLPTDEVDAVLLIDQMVDLGMVTRDDEGLRIPKLREHQRIDNRYFTWCDRCDVDEIPEPARSKYVALTQGTRSAPASARRKPDVLTHEGRKEGSEGDGERKADANESRKRASQLPDTFRPSDKHVELARSLGVDLRAEWPKFVDTARANGKTYKDWDAALRTWIRRAVDYGRGGQPTLAVVTDPAALPPVEQSWMRR